MKFFKNSVLKDMAAEKKGKTQTEKDAIDVDILFMKSMLSDRASTYSGINKTLSKSIQKRENRQKKEEKRTCEYQVESDCMEFENDSESTINDSNIDESYKSEAKRKHRRSMKEGSQFL